MIRTVVDFPANLARWTVYNLELNVRGRSGGDATDGSGQVVLGVQPRWEAMLALELLDASQVKTWRSFISKMKGRVNVMRLAINDPLQLSLSDWGVTNPVSPFSDGSLFSDGAGWATEPMLTGVTAAAGSNTFTVNAGPLNDALGPGQYFSVNDWLYRVTGIYGTPTARQYTFEPALRRAIVSTDAIKAWATCQFALATDMDAAPRMESIVYSKVELQLVENINR
jgi:hypothetical protein